ncbi:VOC family protein [Paenibacillus ginsengarvi]|nr:VOC family protein [Paenibacillus ginsengarvi]
MVQQVMGSESKVEVKEEVAVPSAPLLKQVNCIYVPAVDPYATIKWFETNFGLKTSSKPVKRETNGGSIKLANGMELYILRVAEPSRMTFQTDVWSGPGFTMPMISFEVDDAAELHRSLERKGVHVEELRDNNGCGIGFYFYDPDGNKFCAWEMQTMVWRSKEEEPETGSRNWKERFRFANCYFSGDIDDFLKEAAAQSRQSSRRVQVLGRGSMDEEAGSELQLLVQKLEAFAHKYPERSFRIVYRE